MLDLTIIITTYNNEDIILDTIKNHISFEGQILIIDDHSKDSTYKKALNESKKYKNIKVVQNKKNLGSFKNRMEALKYVKTKFITFLDSDDLLNINELERLFNKYSNSYKVIEGKTIREQNNKIVNINHYSKDHKKIILRSWWSVWGKIWDKDLFKKIYSYSKFDIGEDFCTILCGDGFFFPKPVKALYIYNARNDSLINKTNWKRQFTDFMGNFLNVVNNARIYKEIIFHRGLTNLLALSNKSKTKIDWTLDQLNKNIKDKSLLTNKTTKKILWIYRPNSRKKVLIRYFICSLINKRIFNILCYPNLFARKSTKKLKWY